MRIETHAHDSEAAAVAPLVRHGQAALAIAGLGGAWVVARDLLPIGLPCPMLSLTGVPCPFCGMTRLSDLLFHGDLGRAITGDPGGVAFVVVLTLLALVGIASRVGLAPRRWPTATPVVVALLVALGVHWGTTLAGGGFIRA